MTIHVLSSSDCICEPVPATPCHICNPSPLEAPVAYVDNDTGCTFCGGAGFLPYIPDVDNDDSIYFLHSDDEGLNLFDRARRRHAARKGFWNG